ncbi:LysR family transcriptional regulator [Neobacillus piezotolerans]|uniref:LysR family transcriptional regulator n=1 Tax=Neobacillus piezotolerans TaxID=2259171 RepID=A0A3D8GVG3_9BACI|nr:LysR family transcriptional regulator [Neobacillus piezotolerans]RDU38151.1 LysR family transcriptional regulator [Neobacillus piezotolerans]
MKDLSGKYLKAIAEHGNFSHAARALYISQPYLSKYIKSLEDELGIELVNRKVNPILLTYAGERYLAYMTEIEQTYVKLQNELESISNLKKGRLKLGINPILGSHTLYNILPEFIMNYPGIEIELIEENAHDMEVLLLEGKVDICLNMLPIFNPEIVYETLYEEKLYLVIHPSHKYYNEPKKQISHIPFHPRLLDGEKFILLKQGLGLRRLTDVIFKEYSINPEIMIETQNIESAFRLAIRGVGLTIIPESVITRDSIRTDAIFYTIGNPIYKNHVVISYKKGEPLSAPAQAFLNMAKEKYRQF